jgi:hypothetical protein
MSEEYNVFPQAIDSAVQRNPAVFANMTARTSWRGALYARDEEGTKSAFRVVERARTLPLGDHAMRDSRWMPEGQALLAMTGTSTVTEAAAIIQSIAAQCWRIVAAQLMLVQVPKPAKVFGKMHGQLRDLLVLLRQYGLPLVKLSSPKVPVSMLSHSATPRWHVRARVETMAGRDDRGSPPPVKLGKGGNMKAWGKACATGAGGRCVRVEQTFCNVAIDM